MTDSRDVGKKVEGASSEIANAAGESIESARERAKLSMKTIETTPSGIDNSETIKKTQIESPKAAEALGKVAGNSKGQNSVLAAGIAEKQQEAAEAQKTAKLGTAPTLGKKG